MIHTHAMSAASPSDADLVQSSLTGGSGAFSEIVARYQTLVCSLTYNATGSLSRSEDLAQEVFLTAWKNLGGLREPAKLRAWLCGIARQSIANTLRREGREPVCAAGELQDEHHSTAPDPAAQAISRDEEAILWRSLEQIPETYREPMILFYREGCSVERVAEALELSEDAAKQRLSRGRKLLQEQVALFVAGALRQSTPGRAFTLAVLSALPLARSSAAAATLGATAVKGGAAAKGLGLLGIFSMLIGPIAGCFTAWASVRASFDNVQSERERGFVRRLTLILFALMAAVLVGSVRFDAQAGSMWDSHPLLSIGLRVAWSTGFAITVLALALWCDRTLARIRREEESNLTAEEEARHALAWRTFEYQSKWTLLGWPLLHVRSGRPRGEKLRPAVGWIAIGDCAVGLISIGGWAAGGISLGVVSVGLLPIGILSAGVLSFGGYVSYGLWGAMGSTAVGYLAHGATALAWHAAKGHDAAARLFAQGDHAFAQNANDAAAKDAIGALGFFKLSTLLARNPAWAQIVWLPCLLMLWQVKRARRVLKEGRTH